MNQVAGDVTTQVLALLPCKLEQIEPQLLCALLHTSKSLHDRLTMQPRSCKQLMVFLTEGTQDRMVIGFASWLQEYGRMLETLEIRVRRDLGGEYTPLLGQCISAGVRSLHEPTLRSLAVFVNDGCAMELAPGLFKSPGLGGLEELHLCMTGPWSLLHMSRLTRLTSLRLGHTEQDGGDCVGLPLDCYADTVGGINVAHWPLSMRRQSLNVVPQLPVSLRRLDAGVIGDWPDSTMKAAHTLPT